MLQIPTLAIILGAVGALLILVGVLGGGFTISSATVPKVGPVPRVVSFIVGAFLVLSSIGVGILENPNLNGGETTNAGRGANTSGTANSGTGTSASAGGTGADPAASFPGSVMADPGFNVAIFKAPSLSAPYATGAEDGIEDGRGVEILCTMQGDSVTFAGITSSLWDGVSVDNVVGFVPDVHIATGTVQPTMPNCETLWNQADGTV